HRVLGLEGPAHELVGLRDLHDLAHARDELELLWVERPPRDPHRAEHGEVDTRRSVDVVAHVDEGLDDLLDLLFRRGVLHYDNHGVLIPLSVPRPRPRPAAPGGGSRRGPARTRASRPPRPAVPGSRA